MLAALFAAAIGLLVWLALRSEPAPPPQRLPSTGVEPQAQPVPEAARDAGEAVDAGSVVEEATAKKQPSSRNLAYFTSALSSSRQFRVRVEAAIALGRRRGPRVTAALVEALDDRHPAVRSAAANSLGRIGDRSTLAALERARSAERDERARGAMQRAASRISGSVATKPPPRPTVRGRYYVAVGRPSAGASGLSSAEIAQLERIMRAQVARQSGVRLAPRGESQSAARRVISSGGLAGFHLDTTVASLERTENGTRAMLRVALASYPDRNLRGMVSGSATVQLSGPPERERMSALEQAAKSVSRQLPSGMARAAR
jgi:hypothetical protein